MDFKKIINYECDGQMSLCDCLEHKTKGSIKQDYYIKLIDNKTATDMVILNHYLHRKASCSYAYGLFEMDTDKIKGCIMYGCPASRPLQKGICGTEEANNVIELTRLWISDDVGKNAESFLIANTIKLVPKEIIVSFAEIEHGHLGIVYQSTNWIYTGITMKRTQWQINGKKLHSRSVSRSYTLEEMKEKNGENFYYADRPQKHRYIYFNCNKRRKKELVKKLRYKVFPYPKIGKEFSKTEVVIKNCI